MSTQSAIGPTTDHVLSEQSWAWADLRVFVAANLAGLLIATGWLHRDGRSIILFACYATLLLCSTALVQRWNKQQESPLDIDRTVRTLRTAMLTCGLFICYVLFSVSMQRIAISTFVGCTSVSVVVLRTNRRFGISGSYSLFKRMMDGALALVFMAVLFPLCALISLLIKLDSPGPIFFVQARVGEHGRSFRIFKFRSLHVGAPPFARSPADSHDPRITRVGRLLRRTGLDEVPQLLNVLRGEMSLVGPRPEMPFIVSAYTAKECKRLRARPGITGLWQISPARAFPIHENLEYDLYYIAHRSLVLDLAILCRTLSAVARGVGAV